jgi:hypothetical protein
MISVMTMKNVINKSRIRLLVAIASVVAAQCIGANPEGNPVFRDVFTADPAAMVDGDTVYV